MSHESEERSAIDSFELSAVRAIFTSLYASSCYSDSIELSGAGTEELDISRRGFTYGETGLQSMLTLLRSADLPSFCCKCLARQQRRANSRCATCGLQLDGAAM
eukprot:3431356-Prymnesium_polylepis.1